MMPSGGAVTQPVRQTNRWDTTSSAASPAARPRRMTGRPLDQSLPPSDIVTPIPIAKHSPSLTKHRMTETKKNNTLHGDFICLS